ncbi:MAG: PAS domain S-box protein [Candidatus Eisenbacteria bacterium]|nr:PAS domain S-box protein [Candidatus Eisenbacteria bacterium]
MRNRGDPNMADDFPRTRTVIVARLLVAVVIAVAALFGGAGVEVLPIIILGLIVAGLTGVYLLWDRYGGVPRLLLQVQFAVDIVFVTLVVYFSGGLASPFKLLYFLPVFVASARLGFRAGTAYACGAVAGYLVLSFADPGGWLYLEESGAYAEVATLVVSLLLVAALVGHLSRAAGETGRALGRTRNELMTTRARIASIVDSIDSGLVLVDSSGEVVYLNRAGARILGVSEDAVRGREYRIAFADVPAFCERLAAALESGQAEARAEFFIRRRAGVGTPVGLSTTVLGDGETGEQGVIAIFQDLTEARRIQERLRHEDRLAALGEFAAGLAHEIRNPLNAIKGSVDLLREDLETSGDQSKLLDLVTRESDRLAKLVQDVLHFGRMESGERAAVSLDPLLREVEAVARGHHSHREEIELAVEADGDVDVTGNADQLKRAFLNLTINALESIDGRGRVRLTAVRRSEFASRGLSGGSDFDIAVIVEDTGCGISSEKREEIFHPFDTSKKGGTGLGLSIVDKIVQSHGGRITVASEPGRGSRFVVYLKE